MAESSVPGPAPRAWAKKRKQLERIAMMNEARKQSRKDPGNPERHPESDPEDGPGSDGEDQRTGAHEGSSESSENEEDFGVEQAQEIFDDFMVSLRIDQRKTLLR